jgi:hypothetical protein
MEARVLTEGRSLSGLFCGSVPTEGRVLTWREVLDISPADGHDWTYRTKVLYIENNQLEFNPESPSYEVVLGSLSPHFGGTRSKFNESA